MTREQRIIRKAVEELGKEAPDLSYVRGMLESLVEDEAPTSLTMSASTAAALFPQDAASMDEAAILDAKARAALKDIQAVASPE